MTMRLRQITALLATILIASCGGSDDPVAPDTTVASVAVTGGTTVAPGSTIQLTATPKNAAGTALTGLTASWSSDKTNIATVSSTGLVTGVANGAAVISATISGVKGNRNITVQTVTISPSATVTADASNTFSPQQVDISVGGQVTWNFGPVEHNVTFVNSTGAPSNVGNTANQSVSRTFATAGSFTYNCTIHAGMTGTVIVH
jgi:plastocyanin